MYRLLRVEPETEQRWTAYALSLVAFSLVSSCCTGSCGSRLTCRGTRPTSAVTPHLSFDTTVSFVTNTNWQSYGGENTMSHLTRSVGSLVQHFASAAVGLAVVVAVIRGITRSRTPFIGNFWVDLVARHRTRILLRSRSCSPCSSAARV